MKKLLITISIILVILIISALWVLREAFGPIHETKIIELNNNQFLICDETYNGDFAGEFYDVKFKLVNGEKDTLNLGDACFNFQNWDKDLQLINIGDCYVLPVKDGSLAKLLFVRKNGENQTDTTFSPQDLRYDSLWISKYSELPAFSYPGESSIDSISNNLFHVTYKYRMGENKPFKFYSQVITYQLYTSSGLFMTKNIFERSEFQINDSDKKPSIL